MSRLKKSTKNARVSIAFMLVVLLLTFFSRKIFIDSLGIHLIGLTSTLQNILGFLNLAELGIVSAVAATLYKPLYNNKQNEINDIISIYGYLYRIIGWWILGAGICVALFLPLIFKDSGVSLNIIYQGYFTYLGASLVGYFISYRQTLLDADQKQYIIIRITNISNIGKLLLQIITLKYFEGNYTHWLFIEFLFGIIQGVWLNNRVRRIYPWLKTSYSHGKETKKRYTNLFATIKNVIPHKIGSFVLNQTSSILVYVYSNLSMVTLYTNYTLILSKAILLITTTLNGVGGSVGNLIAEGNKKNIKKIFWELHFIFFLLGSTLIITSYYLIESFISLWLGDSFILDKKILYIILFNAFISIIRNPIGLFLNGYSLFSDTWAPLAEAIINLSIAIVFGYYWGVLGVLLGSSVSLIFIIVIWKPYFLYKKAFEESVIEYWYEFFKYLGILVITWYFVNLFVNHYRFIQNSLSFLQWGRNALLLIVIISTLYTSLSVCISAGGKTLLRRIPGVLFTKN